MIGKRTILAGILLIGGVLSSFAQIDPTKRELIQLGYNQPIEGTGPLAAYGFYFRNTPGFLQHSNLTLRLAVAPVYVDSELGISHVLSPNTDLGIGLAGGGFADSYSEVRQGKYLRKESFIGHAGDVSSSLYHLFNPGQMIPLYGLVRGAVHYSAYAEDSKTARTFELPDEEFSVRVRAGFRLGGREPVMLPDVAMELSVWYEGVFRGEPGRYGYNNDRELKASSHLFWLRGLLTYTLPKLKHNFAVNLTAGTGLDLDRLSAYRLGGNLPLYSEFPLSLPGYYFQELSARSFVLIGGAYHFPLDRKQIWWVNAAATTAVIEYLPGLEQRGDWNSGVGGGVVFRSPSDTWQVALGYGYGINAIRDDHRGAHSISILLQFDLDRTKRRFFDPSSNIGQSRGLDEFMRNVFR
jgi:hypothetical protein